MVMQGFSGSGGGGNGVGFYSGWAQPQMPQATNPNQTNDQLRLLQAQGDQTRQQQLTGLQYGSANAAADRAQQQWSQLTGQGFQGAQNDANRALQTELQNSSQGFQGQQAGLNRDLTVSQNALERTFQGEQANANRGQQLTMQGNQLGFEGQQAGLNRSFTGEQNSEQRQFEGSQGDANRALQLQLGMAPINFAQSKFNAVMPLISNLLGPGGAGGGFGGAGGGALSQQQRTAVGDLWTPQQIDQQVNAAKASNAQSASSASTNAARQTAGRGFGANSPLLAALQGQINASQMGQNAEADRNIRLSGAQANAQNRLQTGTLAEQQWQDAADQAYKRQALGFSGPASLLSALGSFV